MTLLALILKFKQSLFRILQASFFVRALIIFYSMFPRQPKPFLRTNIIFSLANQIWRAWFAIIWLFRWLYKIFWFKARHTFSIIQILFTRDALSEMDPKLCASWIIIHQTGTKFLGASWLANSSYALKLRPPIWKLDNSCILKLIAWI